MKKSERQVEFEKYDEPVFNLDGEELDKALYDCMTTVWKAYRESVTTGTYKPYNACFKGLYERYNDDNVVRFIKGLGFGTVGAMNRRVKNGNSSL